ncbi:conjugation system SOS inhibitor PsiB family protein [Escherichia coli]|uniref:conjugation system SOS inhibitor PsiB family protein n=1 Tax=Escherichia coli TaxID=562 RepID=UPI0040677506|nr:hypothetical protein J4W40_000355 [Escherichia coli]
MYYRPSAQEYEDIRAAGSDERRELTRRDAGTGCAGQLDMMMASMAMSSGLFPNRVRFTPAHERFHWR